MGGGRRLSNVGHEALRLPSNASRLLAPIMRCLRFVRSRPC